MYIFGVGTPYTLVVLADFPDNFQIYNVSNIHVSLRVTSTKVLWTSKHLAHKYLSDWWSSAALCSAVTNVQEVDN